jgi:hypothetical protein
MPSFDINLPGFKQVSVWERRSVSRKEADASAKAQGGEHF